jgi:hypothetical protein
MLAVGSNLWTVEFNRRSWFQDVAVAAVQARRCFKRIGIQRDKISRVGKVLMLAAKLARWRGEVKARAWERRCQQSYIPPFRYGI